MLKYVERYTEFSGDLALQSGNYLAMHAEVPDVDDVTITVKLNTESVLDDDGIAVIRVADKSKNLVVTASKDGYKDVVKTFTLDDLVLGEPLVD